MRGESKDALRAWTSKLLGVETVFRSVQRALLSSRDARRAVDRNLGRILAGLNFPSRQDLQRLQSQLEDLETEISDVARRVEALSEDSNARNC